jgi:uncharacterized protein YbcV (DUF1398 family)
MYNFKKIRRKNFENELYFQNCHMKRGNMYNLYKVERNLYLFKGRKDVIMKNSNYKINKLAALIKNIIDLFMVY